MNHYILILIYCAAIQSCTTTPISVIGFELDHQLDTTRQTQIVLRDSTHLVGMISSFASLSDSTFLITSNGGLICYNTRGEQVYVANNRGRARNEAMNPAAIYVSADSVYLWDADLLKLLVYDKNLGFHSAYTGFTGAISKFTVVAGRYFCCIPTGGKLSDAVVVHELQSNQNRGIETASQGDVLLKLKQGVAAIASSQDSLWFCNPSSLTTHMAQIRNLNDIVATRLLIEDIDFQNIPFEGSATECINNNRELAFSYIFGNSTIFDIAVGDDHIYILAELVESEISKKLRIYKLTKVNTPVETYTLPYIPMTAWKLSEGMLQYITIENIADSQRTILHSMPF